MYYCNAEITNAYNMINIQILITQINMDDGQEIAVLHVVAPEFQILVLNQRQYALHNKHMKLVRYVLLIGIANKHLNAIFTTEADNGMTDSEDCLNVDDTNVDYFLQMLQ